MTAALAARKCSYERLTRSASSADASGSSLASWSIKVSSVRRSARPCSDFERQQRMAPPELQPEVAGQLGQLASPQVVDPDLGVVHAPGVNVEAVTSHLREAEQPLWAARKPRLRGDHARRVGCIAARARADQLVLHLLLLQDFVRRAREPLDADQIFGLVRAAQAHPQRAAALEIEEEPR